MGRGRRRALAVVLLAVATPALACRDEPQAEPPPVQAPAPPMPTPEQLAEAVREAPAAFAELVAVELEAPPTVDAGTPWTDGFGNLLGVAVNVTYDRPVVLVEGAPFPVPTANGCETDCLGRFQPTPEEPYRVVPSEEPVTSSAFTLFYDVRTASLAYVRFTPS